MNNGNNNIREKILAWAMAGGDFKAGLSLFLTFNRNIYYAKNIEAKGVERGMVTLVSEFANKTKIKYKTLYALTKAEKTLENKPKQSNNNKDKAEQPIEVAVEVNNIASGSGASEKGIFGKKLREEFPFLSKNDCPEVLMVLVNKMITAYYHYLEGHEVLFSVDCNDLDACYTAGRSTVDAYIRNREIWEELNYFKIHGKILGNVPELKNKKMEADYQGKKTIELSNILNNNIPRRMSYYKKQLDSKVTKNKDEIRQKIVESEAEAEIVRVILTKRGELK